MYKLIFFVVMLISTAFSCWSQSQTELMVCGDNQVIIFDLQRSQDTVPFVVWRWKASEAFDLPAIYRSTYFRSLDDCKPVDGGNKILISSSSNGVALIDRATQKVLFYAQVGNAHSIEWLPGDRIVVAGSTNDKGNRLELYDSRMSEKPLFKDSLYSAHGVVWDDERELLYALGYDELRAYKLVDWDTNHPGFTLVDTWTIPGISGHDLAAIPQYPGQLLLTEHESVWIFDKNTGKFRLFEPLAGKEDVKAVSFHPVTGRVAYIQAEKSWWSHHVYLLEPERYVSFPGVDLYKVRWIEGDMVNAPTIYSYEDLISWIKNPTDDYVLVVAHRGDWRNAPENSIRAVENCIEMGVDIVEVDVRMTQDSQLVIIHDLTLDRTTTGKGKVVDWPLDSIRTLYLKNGAGGITHHKMPTLKDMMLAVKGKPVLLNLDKAWDFLPQTYQILRETGTVRQAIFKGNETLETMREKHGNLLDSIHYMPMVWPMEYNIYGETAESPGLYAQGYMDHFDPFGFEVIYDEEDSPVFDAIKLMNENNIAVWVNTLWDRLCAGHTDDKAQDDPDAHWGWVIDHGANIIQTDRPALLLEYLREKMLHD